MSNRAATILATAAVLSPLCIYTAFAQTGHKRLNPRTERSWSARRRFGCSKNCPAYIS